jgi:cytochrome c-type biogenesis protein CcsB
MDALFFKIALAAYLATTLGYAISLLVKRVLVARVSAWLFFFAFVIHAASFGTRCILTGQSPVLGMHDALSFLAWIITGLYLGFQLKTKTMILGAFVSPMVSLLMIVASVGLGGQVSIPAALQSRLVPMHIVMAVLGEALFVLASCAGAMYLLQAGLIKRKKGRGFIALLPSLRDLDNINRICLLLGFPLLTAGLLVGSIWARTVWGSHWQWDPKQTWTLMVWICYALLLHQRLAIGWTGHKAAVFSVLAFVFLLVSFIVTNRLFTTLHSFL